MSDPLLTTLRFIWSVFGLYWLVAAVSRRSSVAGAATQTGEPHSFRVIRLLILATTFALLFWHRLSIGILGHRPAPNLPAFRYAGLALTLSGMSIAIWARINLGQYWSDKVVLQAGHQLICTGPYKYMRHPIYSGVLLAVLGTALFVSEVRSLLAFALLFTNYVIKAKREERILAERFGPEFEMHMRQTGFLWPRFRGA